MTDIFIDGSKTRLACRITPLSLHVIGFEIQVIASDRNTVVESYQDKTTGNGISITLKNSPAFYKDKFISGTFTIVSPEGDDFDYEMRFSLLTDDIGVNPHITLKGKTQDGEDITIATFNIN